MLRALRISAERTLPKGWADVLRQVGMFAAAYLAYRLVEGLVNVSNANPAPFVHARDLISFERSLGVFVEPAIQSWANGSHALMVAATYIYITAQTFILFGLLLYLYLRHNRSYYFVRNMMFVAMCLALIGYAAFPTAPPRFLQNWGFVDTVSQITGTSPRDNLGAGGFVNPYAAVPSMHVAFAVMLGWTLVFLVRNWVARVWWALWPFVITAVTVITANHFLIDAVLGLATAAIAASVAFGLARARPHIWAFRPQPATVARLQSAAPQPTGFAAAPSAATAQASAFSSQPSGAVAQSARSVVSS